MNNTEIVTTETRNIDETIAVVIGKDQANQLVECQGKKHLVFTWRQLVLYIKYTLPQWRDVALPRKFPPLVEVMRQAQFLKEDFANDDVSDFKVRITNSCEVLETGRMKHVLIPAKHFILALVGYIQQKKCLPYKFGQADVNLLKMRWEEEIAKLSVEEAA